MLLDFFFEVVDVVTGDDEEDDESHSDWLFDLQEPGGERFTSDILKLFLPYGDKRVCARVSQFIRQIFAVVVLRVRPLQPKSLPQQRRVQAEGQEDQVRLSRSFQGEEMRERFE